MSRRGPSIYMFKKMDEEKEPPTSAFSWGDCQKHMVTLSQSLDVNFIFFKGSEVCNM